MNRQPKRELDVAVKGSEIPVSSSYCAACCIPAYPDHPTCGTYHGTICARERDGTGDAATATGWRASRCC